jgi:hypothetical protein
MVAPLTKFMVEKSKAFNLMSENGVGNQVKWKQFAEYSSLSQLNKILIFQQSQGDSKTSEKPVTHWRPRLTYHILTDCFSFDRYAIPGEIYSLLRYELLSLHLVQ